MRHTKHLVLQHLIDFDWICKSNFTSYELIAVSSATTSTLVVDADEIPQYIEGINKGSRRRRRRGCSSWQMKRL